MEKRVVVDTSVAVKWFVEEEDTKQALLVLDRWRKHKLEVVIPDLLIYEAVNALRFGRKLPKGSISRIIRGLLEALPEIYIITPDLVDLSLGHIFEHNLTIYDAVYIALADMLEIPLVTADETHHRKKISKNIVYLKDLKKIL